MKLIAICSLMAILTAPACAGDISEVGSALEVESYRCVVTSARAIECLNIGRVCVAARAEEEKRSKRWFGCAIKGNENYPCPPSPSREELEKNAKGSAGCFPTVFGSW